MYSSEADTDHAAVECLNLNVPHAEAEEATDHVKPVDPDDGPGRPALRVHRVTVDIDEEPDHPNVVQGEENGIREAPEGAGGGESDEKEEHKRAESAAFLLAREEFRGLAAGVPGPEVHVKEDEENDGASEPAVEDIDDGPPFPEEADRAVFGR